MNRMEMLRDELRLIRRDIRSAYRELDELELSVSEESFKECRILHLEIEDSERRVEEIKQEIKMLKKSLSPNVH